MSKFSKILACFFVCVIGLIALFATGVLEAPIFLDIYKDKQYEETIKTPTQTGSQLGSSNDGSIVISSSTSVDINSIPSALKIKLTGDYLTAYNKATSSLPKDDKNSRVLIKVGLQILQAKVISYENALHFYSLDYKASGSQRRQTKYSLLDCINRINEGKYIYTDCFGFVRLAHSIACYTLNNKHPENVSGLSGLYGYKGGYSQGKTYNSMSGFKPGAVIYDCLTGLDAGYSSGDRHVAMYLFRSGTEVVYMDQSGLHTGTYRNGNHIYSTASKTPYKFNKFKNFN
jgi:hypothetical protein